MRYSVLEIIRKTTAELGLTQPTTVVSNTDSTIVTLLNLLKSLGEELVVMEDWVVLQREYTFTTEPDKHSYPLPADFSRTINQTQWSKTTSTPLVGPATPEQIQALTNSVFSAINYTYRFRGDSLLVLPTPVDAFDVSYEYVSSAFVYDTTTLDYKSDITADTDKLVFDDRLIINGLKLKFKEQNGLLSTPARYDYECTLDALRGADGGAQIVSLNRTHSCPSWPNTPEGNWKA